MTVKIPTKEIEVYEPILQRIPVIETFIEDKPFYYQAVFGKLVKVDKNIEYLSPEDYLVWDKEGNCKIISKAVWNKFYGKYLKERANKL